MSDECRGRTWALGSWEGSDLPPSVAVSCLQHQGLEVLQQSPFSEWGAFQAFQCLRLRVVLCLHIHIYDEV